jgi:hypothetical protein
VTVVAISAAYGARGGFVGPTLAEHWGVPFLDRAIAMRVAGALDVSVDEALSQWEPPDRSFVERLLGSFLAADTGAPVAPPPDIVSPDDFREETEKAVLAQAATGEGVILGRGAVAALRRDPTVLRVRLTGPPQRRLAQAMEIGHLDRPQASAAMKRLDRYHAEYLRQYYGVDIDDPTLYQLTIDATAMDTDACVALIELAARSIR